MGYENNDKKTDSVYSKRVKAGKRRTYFFDVKATRGNDYFLTVTESRKRFNDDGYDRHKIFVYKEDFNKFLKGLVEAVDYVKTELMPDFDFDAFNHEYAEGDEGEEYTAQPKPANHQVQENIAIKVIAEKPVVTALPGESIAAAATEEVEKW